MEETKTEGNKLIAGFMGWQHHEDKGYDKHEMANLKYHSSWDWLMPVVEKICEIDNQAGEEMAAHMKNAPLDDLAILNTSILCHKDEVYKRVVAYITWHNQQTQ